MRGAGTLLRHALLWGSLLLGAPTLRADEPPPPQPDPAPSPTPEVPVPPAPEDVRAAMARGVAWLQENQRPDGGWGTPASTLHDIYAPPPGSQRAFRAAASALALAGLLEAPPEATPEAVAARRAVQAKAQTWLLANHDVRRVSPNTLYNTWTHAYALATFARLLSRRPEAVAERALRTACARILKRLETFEFVEGGWGYYDFQTKAKAPGPGSTSFTTATVLHAMAMARNQGVEMPARLVREALRVLDLTRRPDGAYAYAVRHRYYPQAGVNKIKGSLARTPVCLLAELDWIPEGDARRRALARVPAAFENLERHGHFLRIARKYPIPHETWYQNSGYFCFYGYFYAAELLPFLTPEARRIHAGHLARHLLGMQEKDGSWWDYQLFNFHKPYGTGYVLLALARCLEVLDVPAAPAASR